MKIYFHCEKCWTHNKTTIVSWEKRTDKFTSLNDALKHLQMYPDHNLELISDED